MKNPGSKNDPFCQYNRPTDGLPKFINVSVTTRCNLRCRMCKSYETDLVLGPSEKVSRFFERLADWLEGRKMVFLTGGEPLMHPEVFDFVKQLASRKFFVALNTNGVLLSTKTAHRLEDKGLSVLNVSLDGDSSVHDFQRNGPGLALGVMDMLGYVSRNTKVVLSVVSVISALSASGLPALLEKLAGLPRFDGLQLQAVVPTMGRPWSEDFFKNDILWPRTDQERKAVLDALDRLEQMKRQGYPINNPPSQFELWRKYFRSWKTVMADRPCTVGETSLLIQPDGQVLFCSHYGVLGTIDEDPKILWEGETAKRMRQEMNRCDHPCNFFVNCAYTD